MKQMVYKKERCREILDEGTYKGFNYVIYSLGLHPTAYVEVPKGHRLYDASDDELDYIDVHGGITYNSDHLPMPDGTNKDGCFIGWDYAHCYDYSGIYEIAELPSDSSLMNSKKWTTEEILDDVFSVINQIF